MRECGSADGEAALARLPRASGLGAARPGTGVSRWIHSDEYILHPLIFISIDTTSLGLVRGLTPKRAGVLGWEPNLAATLWEPQDACVSRGTADGSLRYE